MKILIDLDDTVWDLHTPWIEWLNHRHGQNVSVDDIVDWDLKLLYPTLSDEQLYEPLLIKQFWKNRVKVFPEAVHVIYDLYKEHNDIYFITATHYANVEVKAQMVKYYFPFIPIENLIICYDKNMIKGDIIIDDNFDNIKDRNLAILYTSYHNRFIDTSNLSNVFRMDDWYNIYNFINSKSVQEVLQ